MKEPLISVIMSAYNEEEEWLRESILSILNQTWKNLELIVVLDHPENQKLRDVILEYQRKDQRLIFIENEKNLGLVASLNKALGFVKGQYVVRMDADDICDLRRFQWQYQVMEKTGADFVLSAMDFLYDGTDLVIGASDEALGSEQVAKVMEYGNISYHNTWFLKKKVYDQLNGYREVMYCEDLDFVLRGLQEGMKIIKSPHHVVQYRLRSNSVSRSYTMEQAMKGRYLRKKYRQKKAIKELSPKALNRRFSKYTSEEKEKYHKANETLELLSRNLAEKNWIGCGKCVLSKFFISPYFRMLFMEYFQSWIVRKCLAGKGI